MSTKPTIPPPSFFRDGNQWCALIGTDLQSGIAGFGLSPEAAFVDLLSAWRTELSQEAPAPASEANAAPGPPQEEKGVHCKTTLFFAAKEAYDFFFKNKEWELKRISRREALPLLRKEADYLKSFTRSTAVLFGKATLLYYSLILTKEVRLTTSNPELPAVTNFIPGRYIFLRGRGADLALPYFVGTP